ncbi:MAG: hypothetical protein RLZZ522_224, partial [Verrucomicrobiota bacterium]
ARSVGLADDIATGVIKIVGGRTGLHGVEQPADAAAQLVAADEFGSREGGGMVARLGEKNLGGETPPRRPGARCASHTTKMREAPVGGGEDDSPSWGSAFPGGGGPQGERCHLGGWIRHLAESSLGEGRRFQRPTESRAEQAESCAEQAESCAERAER